MSNLISLLIGCVIGAYLQHANILTLPRLPKIDSDVFMVGALAVILALTVVSSWGRK